MSGFLKAGHIRTGILSTGVYAICYQAKKLGEDHLKMGKRHVWNMRQYCINDVKAIAEDSVYGWLNQQKEEM